MLSKRPEHEIKVLDWAKAHVGKVKTPAEAKKLIQAELYVHSSDVQGFHAYKTKSNKEEKIFVSIIILYAAAESLFKEELMRLGREKGFIVICNTLEEYMEAYKPLRN